MAKSVMEAGDLVPDEIVIAILRDRLTDTDCVNGVILDGFPRTIVQAEVLKALLDGTGQKINAAINLAVDEAAMVERIAQRFSCNSCGEVYHEAFKAPKSEGICNKCGCNKMNRRADDNAKALASRLEAYNSLTVPLIAYYKREGILHQVEAIGEINDVARTIDEMITNFSLNRK